MSKLGCCAVATFLCTGLLACQSPAINDGSAHANLTHIEGLGSLSFPNSGNAEAQQPFVRGVLLLHSFEYESAAESFRKAQETDPGFALAYWGEAMTYNHPLWAQKDEQAAMEALERLAPSPQERRARAGNEREALYLDAVERLYGPGSKTEQDRAYMEAMQRLMQEYPEDLEARAFCGLSILGSRNGSRDFATYMRAAATVQPVFEANSDHPGAAHYLIHSFDDPVHAPLGLEAARAYSGIAPNAAHAQHMTTHIFVALGMWDDVIAGNIRARDTQDAQLAARQRRPNVCGHYSSWLHYGYLMRNDLDEAAALMDSCHERMSDEPGDGERGYFVSMRARQIIDTEGWNLADHWLADLPAPGGAALGYGFTNAFAALRRGDSAAAKALLAATPEPDSSLYGLHLEELRGLVALADGHTDRGLEILRQAAATEDSLPFEFGPPRVLKPTFELLGEELLRVGHHEEAATAFRRALERTPGRPLALRGLAAATGSAP